MIVSCDALNIPKPKGFIVLEGLNGSGKSTLSEFICESLENSKRKTCRTFEPGATETGKIIRELLLGQSTEQRSLTSVAEMLLFSADRNLHAEKVIKPALSRHEIVVCDRFFYSTLAFQGYGRGYSLQQIETLTQIAIGNLRPDLVILLDLPPELGLARTKGREQSDSFEAEELSFHQRLRDGFLQIAKERPEPFVILDATQSVGQIRTQAWQAVAKTLKLPMRDQK